MIITNTPIYHRLCLIYVILIKVNEYHKKYAIMILSNGLNFGVFVILNENNKRRKLTII